MTINKVLSSQMQTNPGNSLKTIIGFLCEKRVKSLHYLLQPFNKNSFVTAFLKTSFL